MNGGANKPLARGFKIESLSKLVDTKTIDNQSTMLHYIIRFIEDQNPAVLSEIPKELAGLPDAAKINFDSIKNDLAELTSNLSKLKANVTVVKEKAPDDNPFNSKVLHNVEGFDGALQELQTSFETATKGFRELEVLFKGIASEDDPAEFFANLARFLESFNGVRNELELQKVKKERASQKEEKQKSKLLEEIHRGVKLKPAVKDEEKADNKQAKGKQQATKNLQSELASVGMMASKLASQKKNFQNFKERQQQKKTAGPTELDKLLSQLSK
eukprot:TRINITY_DN6992_c0_g1_i1.p1 TRINITY_DN6992_c0_g1~~TRINITY_DN6992_c0_g1_i1.p1  ORF type:complete len:272 (+),score=118.41 TRINITY_DN6992_c0_g1_i1:218-1033(+)